MSTHAFQAPKGTRDFYPGDLAVRRHIEHAWRSASIDCGFDEVEGPAARPPLRAPRRRPST